VSETQDAPSLDIVRSQARYDSILVHVEPGGLSTARTRVAAHLARSFDARLIGLGAEAVEPMPPNPFYAGTGDWAVIMTEQVIEDLKSAEVAFARDAQGVETEWRRLQETPGRAIAESARACDLIVAGGSTPELGDAFRRADVADVVLTSGRPVLDVPTGAPDLRAKAVLVAWKDTREARRAVLDALPFLVRAEEVVVLAICDADGAEAAKTQTKEVAAMLRRRGAPARSAVLTAPDVNVAEELNAEAAACGADLIVAGGYGHSRLTEWVLGGATRELLRNPQRYLLLSH
jgi:nucleotide-binding universal stress UspA family protein